MSLNSEHRLRTVLGEVPVTDGTHIQCHEHVWLRRGPSFEADPALLMEDFDRSLRELLDYRSAGGGVIIDAQPGGFGRDAAMLRALSSCSGVGILAVTGFHRRAFMEPDCPQSSMREDELAALYVSELRNGMLAPDGTRTDSPAAVVKAAFEAQTLTDPVRLRMLRGAAMAAAQTGAVLMIHTEKGTDLTALPALLTELGVRSERLLLCHLDRTAPDPELHRLLLRKGCTLCYDSVHRYKYVSDAEELALIGAMCADGYGDRIVLSLDTTARRLRAYGAPDMGLDCILTEFIPMLRRAGIPESDIRNMCGRNAASLLSVR